MVRLLAAKGADLNARDIGNETPLTRAVWEKHEDVARFLVAKGADVNTVNSEGVTPLDDAVRYGLSNTIEMLKSAGAKCGTNFAYSRHCKEAEGQN